MADKTSTVKQLKFEWLFVDGDTRVLALKNPKSEIENSEITALENMILDTAGSPSTPLLVGDKTSAAFRRINLVVRETVTTTTYDLESSQ